MRKLVAILLIAVLIPATAFAAKPDGWNIWLYLGEAAAGFLLGLGSSIGVANLTSDEAGDAGNGVATLLAFAGGTTGGVLLIGELIGERSENWYVTYPATFGASAATPLIVWFAADAAVDDEDGGLGIGGIGLGVLLQSVIYLGTPHAAAVTYNLVKKPVMPEKATPDLGFSIKPHSTYLADSNGGLVPTYGVEVSF